MIVVAQHQVRGATLDYIDELGNGKKKTGKNMYYELRKRVDNLTKQQSELLSNGDLNEQQKIAFLAVCKTYTFIRDFVVEVLREKYLVYDFEITEGDYCSFYRQKVEQHPEMESLTEETEKKVRQVLFKILEQAGIIDSVKTKSLQGQIVDEVVLKTIINDHSDWLKIFFLSERDIETLQE